MPLLESQFKVAFSNVPGPTGEDVFYCGHPSGLCRVYVWRPDGWDTVGFTDRPCLVCLHHGFGHDPGDRASEPTSFGGLFGELCALLHARGWCIVSLDYPPAPSNESSNRELIGMAYWAEQYQTVLRGIAWIKHLARPLETNRAKVPLEQYSMHKTLFGVNALGEVNTLNRDLIGVGGRSHGGMLSMFAAWFPTSLAPHFLAPGVLSNDLFEVSQTHKPAFAISGIGQAYWTGFHVDPAQTNPLGQIYWDGVHQQFMRKSSGEKWSEVPMRIKAAASPLCYLDANFAENRSVPVWATWGQTNVGAGSALLATHDDLYVVLDDVAGNKAWWDPHAPIPQAAMTERRIKAGKGDPRSRIVWGNAANNPFGINNDTLVALGRSDAQDAAIWLLETFGV